MVLFKTLISSIIVAAVFGGTVAYSQNDITPTTVGIMRGECIALVIDDNVRRDCSGEVTLRLLADHTIQLVFTAPNFAVSFSGDAEHLRPLKRNGAVFNIDLVALGSEVDDLEETRAIGGCSFGDLYSGEPVSIRCSSSSRFGDAKGIFWSDGKPPARR